MGECGVKYGIRVKHTPQFPEQPYSVAMGDDDNSWGFDDHAQAVHFAAVLEGVVEHHRNEAVKEYAAKQAVAAISK